MNAVQMNVTTHKGRWGYYPCSYETYRKLKALNMAYERALRLQAAWKRWDRKLPKNRVIRKKIRNAQRQVIGYEPPVPMPEPKLCEIFGYTDSCVPSDYRLARYPVANPEDVQPLQMSIQEIDRLFELVQPK